MSGDKEQEYFSDGLSEELLNSLARINELQVAARTSAFSFKGKDADIGTIARKLNVGAVLEGSVRRSAHTVRITTQLINAVTGFHVWSQTYDRDLGDVLKLQSEIATAVASALKVSLLGDVAATIEVGGTRNPAALDAYLRGSRAYRTYHDQKDLEVAIAAFTEAIQLDPNYALAFAGRSIAFEELASWWIPTMAAGHEVYDKAQVDARKAVELAPDLGEAHLVLANALNDALEFKSAREEYERARALARGDARVLQDYGSFKVNMGRTDEGLPSMHRAVVLDPVNRDRYVALFQALSYARQYKDAIAALNEASVVDSNYVVPNWWIPDYLLGNYPHARATCEARVQYDESHLCLALVYKKLGQHGDAEGELSKYKTASPDDWYQFAEAYAQWGDVAKALSCLGEA